ncbi:hypothetical protein PMAYCL1PPCAC_00415, partial [Pristionchus mayeri]
CESVFYSEITRKCFIFGAVNAAKCGGNFTRLVKSNSRCSQYDLTTTYEPDPCLASAKMIPDSLTLNGASSICPNAPAFRDSVARLYVVSVIFTNGSHGILDNNRAAQIIWDESLGYVYLRQKDLDVYIKESIYAANCVYYPDGGNF